jgi:hypothetical protein
MVIAILFTKPFGLKCLLDIARLEGHRAAPLGPNNGFNQLLKALLYKQSFTR